MTRHEDLIVKDKDELIEEIYDRDWEITELKRRIKELENDSNR